MWLRGSRRRRRSLRGRAVWRFIIAAFFVLGPAELILRDVLNVGVVAHVASVVGESLNFSHGLVLGVVLLVIVGVTVFLFFVLLVLIECTLVLLIFGHATLCDVR